MLACFLSALSVAAQQVRPRIAGLEGNAAYMSLLAEDGRLQQREDSVVRAVERTRLQLRDHPEQRQAYSGEILRLEEAIFSIRSARGKLIDRINTIEQEWVLSNLHVATPPPVSATEAAFAVPDSLKRRYLVDNLFFRENLPTPDYEALLRAQRLERVAEEYVRRYKENYRQMQELAGIYDTVRNERAAADLEGKFRTIEGMNRVLSDSLTQTWSYIFDNKTYAYNYLLDKLGAEEELTRREEAMDAARRRLTDLEGAYSSDAVTDYFVQKQLVDDYEVGLARMLGLGEEHPRVPPHPTPRAPRRGPRSTDRSGGAGPPAAYARRTRETTATALRRGGAAAERRGLSAPSDRVARAILPRLRTAGFFRRTDLQLPQSDSRMSRLRAGNDLSHPARHIPGQTLAFDL